MDNRVVAGLALVGTSIQWVLAIRELAGRWTADMVAGRDDRRTLRSIYVNIVGWGFVVAAVLLAFLDAVASA